MEENELSLKIMVIDDVQLLCGMMKDILQDTGYSVKTFTDPFEALIEIPKWLPDIIILDYGLPRMSGVDVMKNIALIREELGFNIGVLGLSGSHPEAHAKFIAAGVDEYMDKPFRRWSLIRVIERIFWKRRGIIISKRFNSSISE